MIGRTRQNVIHDIESFLEESGMTESTFGKEAVGDNKLMTRLRNGAGITLSTVERIETFIESSRSRSRCLEAA